MSQFVPEDENPDGRHGNESSGGIDARASTSNAKPAEINVSINAPHFPPPPSAETVSPTAHVFSGKGSNASYDSHTSTSNDHGNDTKAKETVGASGHRASLADSQTDPSRTAQYPKPPINREGIAKKQKTYAQRGKDETKTLLEHSLPSYLFTVDPVLLKNTRGNPHPTLLDQEVSRVIQNAEINLYLSYINDTNKKIDFLRQYQAIKDKFEGKNSVIAKEMKDFARNRPLLEKLQGDGEVRKEVTFAKDKKYKDKDGKEHVKRKAGDIKSNAFALPPLAKEQIKQTEAKNVMLKTQLNDLKAHVNSVGASPDQ